MSDPVGFLQNQGEKIIFDEAQHVPELFSYLQVISDERGANWSGTKPFFTCK
jgi:hypothetical protein